MNSESNTLPNLQTLIEEVRAGFQSINQRLDRIEGRISSVEQRLDVIERQLLNMDIRLDRLDGTASGAHSEVMNLRADFKEFRSQFNQPA